MSDNKGMDATGLLIHMANRKLPEDIQGQQSLEEDYKEVIPDEAEKATEPTEDEAGTNTEPPEPPQPAESEAESETQEASAETNTEPTEDEAETNTESSEPPESAPEPPIDIHTDNSVASSISSTSSTSSPLSVRISDDMRQRLSALSRATGKTVSSLVIDAINTYIDAIDLTTTERMIYDALMHDNDV